MRLLISGGGTAGHINPALAILDYEKAQNNDIDILYIGKNGGMEEKLVANAGYDIKTIDIAGFSRQISLSGIKKNINTLKLVAKAEKESKRLIKEFDPDICIGTGGYVSGPVIKEAQKLGIPTLIHEQNAFPGVTNKMLAKKASTVMLAVADAKKNMPQGCKLEIVGNPLRGEILTADREKSRKSLKLDERPVILSFGGSLGARAINEAMADVIKETCKTDKYQHIHGYGQYGKWFIKLLREKGVNIEEHSNLHISEYINNMPECMAAADLVICRAGAITVSELQAMGKASILIPSPNVAENHQFHNAMALVNRNAADILEEKFLTGKALNDKINKVIENKDDLSEKSQNAKSMAIFDSNERIHSIIMQEKLNRQ